MVHSIVTHHGGYINLYSEPGKGTRFNIYLPVAADTESSTADEPTEIRGTETILVVDDEAYVREMCRDILAPLGYEIMLAGGGSDCINLFSRMRERISLVILDMIMPKMGGNEVFQALKAMDPNVKVLLCSGYSSNGFAGIDKLLRGGANGFIQKPFSRQDIALAIRKALST
jgi:DNA-binding NtrC family response regulator